MTRPLAYSAAILAATLSIGCAGLEQSFTSLAGPSGTSSSSIAPSSLLGTWSTSGQSVTGSSCTNVQWRVTAQSTNALSGEFSADCVGGISISGTASGQLSGDTLPYQITGTGSAPGVAGCAFSLSGTARLEGDAIRIPYSGITCLGPIRGEEVLRRRTETAPPPPAPEPEPEPAPEPEAPPPAQSPYHVGPGPLSEDRAKQVVFATSKEYPYLTTARNTEDESRAAALELLRRMIWHLKLAGFQAGRQKNPSGAISGDKLTVFLDGKWEAYDVFSSVGTPGRATPVIFLYVGSGNTIPDEGIPD